MPLAEAVVFAMIGSYVLSRTLVPTLANYLLRKQAHAGHEPHAPHAEPPTRNPLLRFQRGFEHRFEQVRSAYGELLDLALGLRWRFVIGFVAVVAVSFVLVPYLGRNFFPTVDGGQIKLHMRAQIGTRIEETSRLCAKVEAAVRQVIPPHDLDNIVDNIGLPISGINMAYGNSGTIGARTPIS